MTEKEKGVQQNSDFISDGNAVDIETDSKLNNGITAPEEELTEPKQKPKRMRKAPIKRKTSAKEKTEEACSEILSEETDGISPTPTELPSDEEISIPIFDISSDDFSSLSDEEFSADCEYDDEEFRDGEIIPPDMLFADVSKPLEEKNDEEDSLKPEEEVLSDEEADVDNVYGEEADEDGQYTIADLEQKEEKEKGLPDYNPKKPRRVDSRFDLVELFVFTLVAVMILMSFFFRHSIVNGASMENTLHNGEHLIISDFLYTPKRGDVVVCEDHTTNLKYPIVKRIIALGGDTVKITENGVFVNGVPEENPHVYFGNSDYKYTPYEITVPKGEIFVMGDHRDNSTDSRDPVMLGTVKEDAILGRVLFRFFPFDKFGTID